ncbi:lysophospholipid acyltransferase family protein [Roseateles sp. BYS180W]|uniref:Lysophospholipid acyltransferase family protein n=1 Tax=Roseateles rivi TaxID=3299028 RepID=A0ABW7FR18_9BURK
MWVLRWMSRWPLWVLQALGAALGVLTNWVSPTYRRRLQAHVAQAGFEPQVARAAVRQAGRMLGELPWVWARPQSEPASARVQWVGAERVEALQAQGRGVLVLTPHMGCFEVAAQAFAERFGAITVMYRPSRQALLRPIVEAARERPGVQGAPASLLGVRKMLRALRQKEAVGLLPDQVPPEGLGVWAPFFGREAYTMTLAARLLQQTDAGAVALWSERLPGGAGYRIHVLDGPRVTSEMSPVEAARCINESMEGLIRLAPDQYLWGYNRYKPPRAVALEQLGDGS